MFTRIVVPLDGSKLSEQVLPYAAMLARGLGGGLHLVHVVETGAAEERHRALTDGVIEQEQAHAGRYLTEMREKLAQSHLPVTARSVSGRPGEAIVAEAEREAADAIAMATHGRSGMERLFLGSVADKVLHATTLPVLLVRPRDASPTGPEPELRTLLVPLDGSDLAEQVLPTAERLAQALGLKVLLLRAVSMPVLTFTDAYGVGAGAESYVQVLEALEEEADKYLGERAAAIDQKGLTVEWLRGRTDAATEIVSVAAREAGTLVVMSTHGRSGLGRAVLGSVADRVVREYQGPVVLLHGEE